MSEVRVAVVGVGPRGLNHLEAMQNLPTAEVVGYCDPSSDALARAAAMAPQAEAFSGIEELMTALPSGERLDAVVTSGPQELNAPMALPFVEAGVATLMEKPPGIYLHETQELVAAQQRGGAPLMVAFNRRFHPLLETALAAVRERGPVVQVVAEFHKSLAQLEQAGRYTPAVRERSFVESPIHAVDWALYAAGDRGLQRLHAASGRAEGRLIDSHAALAVAESGTIIQLTAAYTTGGRLERYEIHGLGISAYLEGVRAGHFVINGETSPIEAPDDDSTGLQAAHFIDLVVRGGTVETPACGTAGAIRAMEVVEAVVAAADG